MHPYMSQSLAAERIRDMIAQATEDSRSRQARHSRRPTQADRKSRGSTRLVGAMGHSSGRA
jgi:hypothetical protein